MTEPFRYKSKREKLDASDPKTLDMLTKLATHLGLTKGHIAQILGVARSTFYEFLEKHEEAMNAYEAGRAMGRLDFVQTGLLHARSDPATWRHLSKDPRFLGIKDEPKAKKAPEGVPDAPGTTRRLSRDELMGRIVELSGKVVVEDVRKPANHGTTGRGIVKR